MPLVNCCHLYLQGPDQRTVPLHIDSEEKGSPTTSLINPVLSYTFYPFFVAVFKTFRCPLSKRRLEAEAKMTSLSMGQSTVSHVLRVVLFTQMLICQCEVLDAVNESSLISWVHF